MSSIVGAVSVGIVGKTLGFNVPCVRNTDYMGENNTREVFGEEIAPEATIEEYSSKPVISI